MSLTLHTSCGDLKIELQCEKVPILCENFLQLCAGGAYDGLLFHRNVPGFIIQGGDPTGKGKGGEAACGGKLDHEFHPDLKHAARGVVSMASNGPHTIGSQFFVTYALQPTLDGEYSVIGRVIDGFDTLDAMERVPVSAKYRPTDDIVMTGVTIHANPFAAT